MSAKRYRKWIAQALRESGPLTAADIGLVVKNTSSPGARVIRGRTTPRRNTPTRNQVTNIVAKFPEFRKVGSIRVPGQNGSKSYTVPLWDLKE